MYRHLFFIIRIYSQSIFLNQAGYKANSYKYQNYPNPFNPSTRIKYSIPARNKNPFFVRLKIYDVLGNLVAVLVNEEKYEGTYEIVFNAENLSSGIYFYRLTAGEFSSSKKMAVVK